MSELKVVDAVNKDEDIAFTFVCALEGVQMDREVFHQVWEENMQDDTIHYYFLMESQQKIGFSSLRIRKQLHHCAKIAEIEEFIICDDKRRLHFGSIMFQELRKKAIEEGCFQLELSSRDIRKEAHSFYRSQGMAQRHFKFTDNLH